VHLKHAAISFVSRDQIISHLRLECKKACNFRLELCIFAQKPATLLTGGDGMKREIFKSAAPLFRYRRALHRMRRRQGTEN